ncbi:MerC family mercury resistance protein [Aequorivita echinoideorum]|uniref:MerC family mercury resistance protein n=1 Tax=Aequorivita echinoideorum TaxID=1549647 RepID=A0ABS5S4M5_9FLAO|nr:MerC family mercury resistance protein [Aequorivita echinoideorum]MBT0607365.1 MerC family mercury resistance protein [Aequorivita echinoideorum]
MKERLFDLAGMGAALLCLIHCLLLPLLLIVPFGITDNPYIDMGFLFLGAFPVYRVLSGNATRLVKMTLLISFILIAVSIVVDLIFHMHTGLIYVGAFGLITGHFLNYRSQRN